MLTGLSREKWCSFHICISSSPLERVASSSANWASWPTWTQELRNCSTSKYPTPAWHFLLLLYHAHLKIILKKCALNSSFISGIIITLFISLFPFPSLNPPIFHSLLFQTRSIFHCCYIHICICIYITKYNLLSLYNVYVCFQDWPFGIDNQSVCLSLRKTFSHSLHSLVVCSSLCGGHTFPIHFSYIHCCPRSAHV